MKLKSFQRNTGYFFGISLLMVIFMASYTSCGNSSSTQSKEKQAVDDEAFYATQPVNSGLYEADYYDITGTNPRKGHFDGRIYFSLSPETSAFYVFENGNRTKIDYIVNLQKPFEKGDSGIYRTVDVKDRPVSISSDSAAYYLNFQRSGEDIKISFNPKPRHTGSAVEIMEKMAAQNQKNKK